MVSLVPKYSTFGIQTDKLMKLKTEPSVVYIGVSFAFPLFGHLLVFLKYVFAFRQKHQTGVSRGRVLCHAYM